MSLLSTWNPTCCTLPAVASSYEPKGTHTQLEGFDTYVTGPAEAKQVVVGVFDIFGFSPQTKQGADILAATTGFRVLVPDWFHGQPLPLDVVPFDTPEKQKRLTDFFSGTGSFDARTEDLKKFITALKNQGVTKVGVYGLCWGGKVTISAAGENTPLDAAALVHPAQLSLSDFEKATIPVAFYPSGNEPQDEAAKVGEYIAQSKLTAKSDYKLFADNHHGWAAARANLEDPKNLEAFKEVYARLSAFFSANLKA